MSIITAAITPHSPLLIPNIGKEHLNLLEKTYHSFGEIKNDLYAGQIDTILIFSAHESTAEEEKHPSINIGKEFVSKFEDFGDFSSKITLPGDVGLAQTLKDRLEDRVSINMIHQPELDHGIGVPLYMLAQELKNIKIVPIYPGSRDLQSHFEFGEQLRRPLLQEDKRIAIIASGDLAHSLSKNSPAGYSSKAAGFDQKIIESIKNKEFDRITDIKEKTAEEVQTCALEPLSILLGIFNTIQFEPELLCYEHPFGVGYLTMKFNL